MSGSRGFSAKNPAFFVRRDDLKNAKYGISIESLCWPFSAARLCEFSGILKGSNSQISELTKFATASHSVPVGNRRWPTLSLSPRSGPTTTTYEMTALGSKLEIDKQKRKFPPAWFSIIFCRPNSINPVRNITRRKFENQSAMPNVQSVMRLPRIAATWRPRNPVLSPRRRRCVEVFPHCTARRSTTHWQATRSRRNPSIKSRQKNPDSLLAWCFDRNATPWRRLRDWCVDHSRRDWRRFEAPLPGQIEPSLRNRF